MNLVHKYFFRDDIPDETRALLLEKEQRRLTKKSKREISGHNGRPMRGQKKHKKVRSYHRA